VSRVAKGADCKSAVL